jgi:hypothetical protein
MINYGIIFAYSGDDFQNILPLTNIGAPVVRLMQCSLTNALSNIGVGLLRLSNSSGPVSWLVHRSMRLSSFPAMLTVL